MSTTDALTPFEKRAGMGLSAIFGLRMLGLFLVLPVFSLYGQTLPGGDALSIGIAIGIYGFVQAWLQIPLGMAADHYGRKRVIVCGLLVFAGGSFIAASATTMHMVIVGRIFQGAGAISAAITALAADLTRPTQRSKIMGMIGSSIGLVFALSLIAAPILYRQIGMPGIFALMGALSFMAIIVLYTIVPAEQPLQHTTQIRFAQLLTEPSLQKLNFGVLALHTLQTAMWVVVPQLLVQHAHIPVAMHGYVYAAALFLSFLVMVPLIIKAERKQRSKATMLFAIVLLVLVQLGFMFSARQVDQSVWLLTALLTLFFIAFNLLEALQPSMISRLVPAVARGRAMGIYNTAQSIGLFTGGFVGGFIVKYYGVPLLFALLALLAVAWALFTRTLVPPVQNKEEKGENEAKKDNEKAVADH